jgi:hypothetical protein
MKVFSLTISKNDDEAWSRQRRIVAPALNERIVSEVWRESIAQALPFADLLMKFTEVTTNTIPRLCAVAINVLTRVAYGSHKPFVLPSTNYDLSVPICYMDAISLCTDFLVVAAFVSAYVFMLPVMPRSMQRLGAALKQLPEKAHTRTTAQRLLFRDYGCCC